MNEISSWVLGAIAFAMSITSACFSMIFNNEELFDKYRHWLRPLLFASAFAWFTLMIVIVGSLSMKG